MVEIPKWTKSSQLLEPCWSYSVFGQPHPYILTILTPLQHSSGGVDIFRGHHEFLSVFQQVAWKQVLFLLPITKDASYLETP
jgi:hypothetical protein